MRPRWQHRIVSAVSNACAIGPAIDRHQRLGKRCALVTDNEVGSSFLRRRALHESEIADPCLPVFAAGRCVVLVSIIKRAIVHRINGHVAIVTPPSGFLAPVAVKQVSFTRQNIQWISGQSAGITDLRVNRSAGSAKTERNIPLVIRANSPGARVAARTNVYLPPNLR